MFDSINELESELEHMTVQQLFMRRGKRENWQSGDTLAENALDSLSQRADALRIVCICDENRRIRVMRFGHHHLPSDIYRRLAATGRSENGGENRSTHAAVKHKKSGERA